MRLPGVLLLLLAMPFPVVGQVASDYYNKPTQELFATVSEESTFVHRAGFEPCFHGVLQWARKNRTKYNFLSVAAVDSLGIVRITSTFDCQSLFGPRRPGSLTECNLILTSSSNSLKIGYGDLKSRDCGALWRVSIQKELVSMISLLPDSTPSPAAPASYVSRGVDYTKGVDSIFEKIRADSIARADSVLQAQVKDSIAGLTSIGPDEDTNSVDDETVSPADQAATDSIGAVVSRDSIVERKQAWLMFKGQPNLEKKKVDIETKLECIVFLLSNKMRKPECALTYLESLRKLSFDLESLYYAARKTVPPEEKYLCVLYYKKQQTECGKVQDLIEKIEDAHAEMPEPVVNRRLIAR